MQMIAATTGDGGRGSGGCGILCRMRWKRKRRALLQDFEDRVGEQISEVSQRVESAFKQKRSGLTVAMKAAWVTGALAVLAGGLYAGKELRLRYQLKRRTPYDYYAHAGDRRPADLEFGVGI